MADDYLINDLLDSLDELNGEIDELYTAVVDFLNGLPWWVPDWLVDKVVDKWDEFNTKVTSEMTSFQADINAAGKSYSLRDAADEWTSTISAGLSGLAGTVEGGELAADDKFSGEAATVYQEKTAPKQQTAIAAVEKLPNVIAGALNDTADSINACLGKYIVAIGGLIVAVVSTVVAVTTAATGVGAVLGIAGAIAGVVTFVGAIVVAEMDSASDIENIEETFRTAQADWEGFDRATDGWPAAVTA